VSVEGAAAGERIGRFVAEVHPFAHCDACLAIQTGLAPETVRQAIARLLVEPGRVARRRGFCYRCHQTRDVISLT
jgi:hypothetical protein